MLWCLSSWHPPRLILVGASLQRAILSLLPAVLLLSFAASAVWGDSGLLARERLAERLVASNAELARIERENQRLLRDLRLMDRDPAVLERLIADEIGWSTEGTLIVRFGEQLTDPDPGGAPEVGALGGGTDAQD